MQRLNIRMHPAVIEMHSGEAGVGYLKTLYRQNEKALKQAFGEPTKKVPVGPKRSIKVWEVGFAAHVYHIHFGRNTEYHILYPESAERFQRDSDAGEEAVEFLQMVHEKTNG